MMVHSSTELEGAAGLSQELIDLVIDELANDRNTLRACCLVARSWVYRSQAHLHHHILMECGDCCFARDPDRYYNPVVAQHVRNLSTSLLPNIPTVHCHDSRRRYILALWTIISRFTSLTHLSVTFYDFAAATKEDLEMWSTCFPNVTRLSLYLVKFENVLNLLAMVAMFPSLRELSLTDIQWPDVPQPSPSDTQNQAYGAVWKRVKSLSFLFSGCDPHIVVGIANWLVATPVAYRTEGSLDVWWQNKEGGVTALPTLLHGLGPSLSLLRISISMLDGRELSQQKETFIGLNSALQVLHLEKLCYSEHRRGKGADAYSWIPLMLQQITSNDVHTIILSCEPLLPSDMRLLDWVAIDEILSRSPFDRSLRSVVIQLWSRSGATEKIGPQLREMLGRTLARGILALPEGL